MTKRMNYRKKNTYHTKYNVVRKTKTPGSNLVYHIASKKNKGAICRDTQKPLIGIPQVTSCGMHRLAKSARTVKRPYGGCKVAGAVKDRITRAFLIEEAKLIKRKKADKRTGDKKAKPKRKAHSKAK